MSDFQAQNPENSQFLSAQITYYKSLSGFFRRIIQVSRDPPWVPIMLPKDTLPGVVRWKIAKNPKSGPLHPPHTPGLQKSRHL